MSRKLLMGMKYLPSSLLSLGSRRERYCNAGARADGVVNMQSQMFWMKKAGETVPERRSKSVRTYRLVSVRTCRSAHSEEHKGRLGIRFYIPGRRILQSPLPGPEVMQG